MSVESESLQVPNWLSELEKKRENRLKGRLGHEAGAGAPCIKCASKCPGLDLHFWRKICKICKCSKEDHDVHDDDIYGWAQFQLLGSKPQRIKKTIVLPGKKDEVELEWAPKGPTETIDNYLKTLSPDSLPVKGSQAAQARKQLLQKQIPIHDIDPSLCHDLTDSELAKMQDYIEHMKNSAGVGQVIQYSINYGNLHRLDEANAKFLTNRPNKEMPSVENVQLQAGHLAKQLATLDMKDQQELDAFFDKIPKPHNMNFPKPSEEITENMAAQVMEMNRNLPHYAHSNLNIQGDEQKPTTIKGIRDLAYSTHDYNNSNYNNQPLQGQQVSEDQLVPTHVNIGAIKDITYEINHQPEIKSALCGENDFYNTINQKPKLLENVEMNKQCRRCGKFFTSQEFAIFLEKSNALYHSECFKCFGCNQNLADLIYFYDREMDEIYCGRDFAKIRGIPRCKACDELIFVKEYCLAENGTFHVKHFCCFECDEALAGKNYVLEDSQPVCLPCFEKVKANKCEYCMSVIKPDEQGLELKKGVHFHANEQCFSCYICKKPLFGAKLLYRNQKLYCSHDCFANDQ